MDNGCGSGECSAKDLTGRKTGWFLWYLPILLVIVGSSWNRGRVWLWGASFCCDGRGLPRKCSTVWTNPLLRYRAAVPLRSGFRRPLGVGCRDAAPRSVSAYRSRSVLFGAMCRDSSGQIPKALTLCTCL